MKELRISVKQLAAMYNMVLTDEPVIENGQIILRGEQKPPTR